MKGVRGVKITVCIDATVASFESEFDNIRDASEYIAEYLEGSELNSSNNSDGWISVKDRLPGPWEKVTTCWTAKDIYWMPLPEPPKDNG